MADNGDDAVVFGGVEPERARADRLDDRQRQRLGRGRGARCSAKDEGLIAIERGVG